jgi:predicted secreted protein
MGRTFTSANNGSSVQLPVNKTFLLELAETPVTGYRWQIVSNTGIEIISSGIILNKAASAGSGGVRRFAIQLTGPGSFHLVARLRRSWEDENIFIDSFEMHLHAE